MSRTVVSVFPSPGTPGEGRGEGLLVQARCVARSRPSPCPLPAYREREFLGRLLLVALCALASMTARAQAPATQPARAFYNVTDFGAVADGETNTTKQLQAAIDAAAASGGGTVVVPAGNYVTGTIWLKSNITLDVQAGATLLGSQEIDDFPMFSSKWEGPR